MKAFLVHLGYDFRTGFRDKSKLLMYYLFPGVFFLIVGGLMSSINPGFKDLLVPAMTLFAFMSSTLMTIPSQLVAAREAGVFRSFRINGVPSASVLAIPTVSTAAHMAVAAAAICAVGVLAYGAKAPAESALFAVTALLSYAAYAGIGVLIGAAAASGTVAILAGQLVFIPSIILGGLMIPASALPPALARLSLLLPASHCMRALEWACAPGSIPLPWVSIGTLAACAAICFGLAAFVFQWDARSSSPSRRAWTAFLGIVPFALAALAGA
jgi:ABC-2 type transport system permease protein